MKYYYLIYLYVYPFFHVSEKEMCFFKSLCVTASGAHACKYYFYVMQPKFFK